MQLSELSEATGLSVATIKYYVREGLIPSGRLLSRTRADYGPAHVERIQLIRALTGTARLDIATVRRVLEVLDDPAAPRIGVLEAAQRSLLTRRHGRPAEAANPESAAPEVPDEAEESEEPSRTRRWIEDRGWQIAPDDPLLEDLEAAWDACEDAGIGVDESRMDAYADAVESIARTDLSTVPEDPSAAVRQVVLGTLLVDPVLMLLRRLAQQHLSVSADGRHEGGGEPPAPTTEDPVGPGTGAS